MSSKYHPRTLKHISFSIKKNEYSIHAQRYLHCQWWQYNYKNKVILEYYWDSSKHAALKQFFFFFVNVTKKHYLFLFWWWKMSMPGTPFPLFLQRKIFNNCSALAANNSCQVKFKCMTLKNIETFGETTRSEVEHTV